MSNKVNTSTFGIPSQLKWGYLGVLIFMMGYGVEQVWLSPYLIEHGMNMQQSASLFTIYGVTIAISSWFSGVLAESYGPRRSMVLGVILYIMGTTGFVGLGMAKLDFGAMFLFYAIRGFGYPLFAYSFMVWITKRSPQKALSTALGWFWFVFIGGLNVLGTYYSNHIGYENTLWSSTIWVLIGVFLALVVNKDTFTTKSNKELKFKEIFKGQQCQF